MNYEKIVSSKELRFKILDMFSWVPDEPWLKLLFRIKNGYWMDFKNPKTFNEKLQWLKIHGFRPEYTQMVDKCGVKNYVTNKIGAEYVIPTLGVWDKPEDINWDKLPNEFVLKTTTGGGGFGVWIVKDKSSFNREMFSNEVYVRYPNIGKPHKKHINAFREHPYDGVQERILAEKILKVDGKIADLEDYKFYCFNGEPLYCQVIRNRSTEETIDFYDMEWKHMPFVGLNPVCKNGLTPVDSPDNLEDMKRICRELAKNIPFARIDLYEVNGKVFFGEITFYPAGGFGKFTPNEWNLKLGQMLELLPQ